MTIPSDGFDQASGETFQDMAMDRETLSHRTVYFDFDSSFVRIDEQYKVDAVGELLNEMPNRKLVIDGHCDERGTIEYNLALGERRASAVRDYLVSLGVDAFRIRIVSYGEEDPADPGHDEAAWARNRRGVFVIES